MPDYTIGGHSEISGLSIGTAIQIENRFQFTNLPNTQYYPNPLSNHWKLEGTFWLSDGGFEEQQEEMLKQAFVLCELENFKLGCVLWCNNSNIPHGVYPNQIPMIENMGDFRVWFFLYDNDGIYWNNGATNFSYIVNYDEQIIGYHPQERCYIWLYTQMNSQDGAVYACNSPSNLVLIPPPISQQYWEYLAPGMVDTGVDYSNHSSFWVKLQDREGTVVSVDEIEKEGDTSESGGGDGNYNNNSIPIPFSNVPTKGFANSGLGRLFHATVNELNDFARWLYSGNSSILDELSKMWSNPLDSIVSLGIVPIMPTHLEADREVVLGYTHSGVYMTPITNQYEVLDCGTLNVEPYYGSSLDYGQYTKILIFLPYIGYRSLKPDEVMGGSVAVRYIVDLATGSCIAQIKCTRQGLDSVLYQFEGNIFIQVPLMARDFSQVYQSIIRGVAGGLTSGNPATAVSGGVNSALNVMASKPITEHSGSLGASGGFMGVKIPYLIIERPIQSLPPDYAKFYGYPSNMTMYLSNVIGYTEVEEVHLNNFGTATTEELERIKDKLKKGVIF